MSTITITVELKDSELAGALAEMVQVLERRGARTSAGNNMGNAQAISPAEYAAKGGAGSPQAVSPAATGKNGTAGSVSAAESGAGNGMGSPQAVSPAATGKNNTAGAVSAAESGAGNGMGNPQAVSPAATGKNNAAGAVSAAESGAGSGKGNPQAVSPAATAAPPMLSMPSAPHGTGSGPLVWSLPGSNAADLQAARRKGSATSAGAPAAGAERARLTFDDIARAAWSLVEAGRGLLFRDLLGRFGVQALTQLPRERFEPFAEALRQLGVTV